MKKPLLIAILICHFVSGMSPVVFGEEIKSTFKEEGVSFSTTLFKTPLDLEKYLNDNFIYIQDLNSYTKNTKELFEDQGGDCEDFAVFNYKVLLEMGYAPQIVVMWNEDKGHAIVFFEEKSGKLSFFSNIKYVKTNLTNKVLIRTNYFGEYKNYVSCDLSVGSLCYNVLNNDNN